MCDKKARIMRATEKLLADYGFHGLSMQMVAREAGVATGTIYRYFEDKEDLMHQLYDHILSRVAQLVTQNVTDDMSLKERFRTMWLNIWAMAYQEDAPLINRGQFENLPRRNTMEQQQLEQKLFSKVHCLFEEGKAQGLLKPLDNEILSVLGLEPSACLARKHLTGVLHVDEKSREAALEACWDAITQHD